MWWNRRHEQPAPPEDVMIKARLKKGETLQITFQDDREPRQVNIEGWGEVRLRIKSQQRVSAELRAAEVT
jgi:hypothetical protein